MAGRTARFGFSTVGGDDGGSLSDDGSKYTLSDRVLLDEVLSAIERHDHSFKPAVDEVEVGEPSLFLGYDGTMEGGIEYFYRVSLINEDGSETEASEESSIFLPDVLSTPEMPVVANIDTAVQAGSLASGLYYYAVSARRGREQSALSTSVPANVVEGYIRLELPELYEGADSYTVWRQGPGEQDFSELETVTGLEYIDDGSIPANPYAGLPGHTSPEWASGASNYSVRVMLPAGLEAPHGWKIYRSDTSGFYGPESLVELVTANVDEFDPTLGVVAEWVDDGDLLLLGSPREIADIAFRPFSFTVLDSLPDASRYPLGYPVMVGEVLRIRGPHGWVTVAGGGGGGGGGSSLPIFTSPNGSRFVMGVDDSGAVTMTPTELPGPPGPLVFSV